MNPFASSGVLIGFLIVCVTKATVLFVAAWIIAAGLRKRSAELRHLVWVSAMMGALLIPLLTVVLPAWHSAALGNAAGILRDGRSVTTSSSLQNLPSMIVNATTGSSRIGNLANLALLIWGTGLLFFALRIAAGIARLRWVAVYSKPIFEGEKARLVLELTKSLRIKRTLRVLECGNPAAMPLTWGIFRPLIVLPAGSGKWDEERLRAVLSHEMAHIVRWDWLFQIAGEIAKAIYWFHPMMWMGAERLRQESERACDDCVLNSGVEPSVYAQQLLELAQTLKSSSGAWSAALAFARPTNLERRFIAMLNSSVDRRNLSWRTRMWVAASVLCLLVPLAAVRLPAQEVAGKFSGAIHDPSGTGVSNATVVMTNIKTNAIQMTTSDVAGNFNFKDLPSGEYEMKAMKPGFKEYKVPQVMLEPGRDSSQNIALSLGSIKEEVDVTPEEAGKESTRTEKKEKPMRVRLGGEVEAAQLLTKVTPIYPEAARTAGTQGTVILHAVVGMNGTPLSLRVMNNQIDPELARASVEAVSKWRYRPTLLNGEPVEVDTTIQVNFRLEP